MPHLQCVAFPQEQISPQTIKWLRSLPQLKFLIVIGGQDKTAPDRLLEIASVRGLAAIKLPTMNDELAKAIAQLEQLEYLEFQSDRIDLTVDGMRAIAKLPRLESVSVDGLAIDGYCLEEIAQCKSLINVEVGPRCKPDFIGTSILVRKRGLSLFRSYHNVRTSITREEHKTLTAEIKASGVSQGRIDVNWPCSWCSGYGTTADAKHAEKLKFMGISARW